MVYFLYVKIKMVFFMNQDNIGKIIKDLRRKNNLSQKAFANKFGVTYQAVSKWENGKNIPDITIIQEICKEYDLSLDTFFDNKKEISNKKNYLILIIVSIVTIILTIILFIIIGQNNDFEFKNISSNCNDFKVTGSIAYNSEKTSIYISDITYCGKDVKEKYNNIKCVLYENKDKINREIDSCNYQNNENITLEEFLQNVKFNVDNYEASCKKYKNNNLFLEIEATNQNNENIFYKIPLDLVENCS